MQFHANARAKKETRGYWEIPGVFTDERDHVASVVLTISVDSFLPPTLPPELGDRLRLSVRRGVLATIERRRSSFNPIHSGKPKGQYLDISFWKEQGTALLLAMRVTLLTPHSVLDQITKAFVEACYPAS